jgi:hypothetical protein
MDLFEYKAEVPTEDGGTEQVVLHLKPIALVPIGVLRKNRRNLQLQMWDMFEWGLSDDELDVFDRIPSSQLEKIVDAWQADEGSGGVEAGESDASSSSSTSTGRRSKQTSSATASG